jgi:hypothetical protein
MVRGSGVKVRVWTPLLAGKWRIESGVCSLAEMPNRLCNCDEINQVNMVRWHLACTELGEPADLWDR